MRSGKGIGWRLAATCAQRQSESRRESGSEHHAASPNSSAAACAAAPADGAELDSGAAAAGGLATNPSEQVLSNKLRRSMAESQEVVVTVTLVPAPPKRRLVLVDWTEFSAFPVRIRIKAGYPPSTRGAALLSGSGRRLGRLNHCCPMRCAECCMCAPQSEWQDLLSSSERWLSNPSNWWSAGGARPGRAGG